jgi:transmembrane sensor
MIFNQEIVERFLQNKCTDEERQAIETWYFSFEHNLDGINQMPENEQIALENELYLKIKRKIQPFEAIQKKPIAWSWYFGSVAAIFLLAFGIWTYNKNSSNIQAAYGIPFSGWAKYENVSSKKLKINLPDGSIVVLQPKTQLSYNQSETDFREVNLTGEAFFDVKRDITRPFYIYSGKMTTKVLGTSFNIKAYPNMKRSEVSVISGKVTVYENEAKNKKDNGVILTPNLKVTFFDEEEHFITGLVEKPEILQSIKKEMVLDNENLGKCTLTGDLENMPLFTKLDIISRSLNATYQIKGTSILVSGRGCE